MNKAPDCNREDCEPQRTGPVTPAENPEHPEADRKTPMKCDKCGKEWYYYF